ncbi:hypothetical protein BGW41_002238 [Actinomortierella wolfii]|nr:hypothetical protein BGW41_002238 [Actinomortierella wolfii]
MCGRTAQGLEPAQIREDLAKTLPKPPNTWIDEDKYRTSYNVAPTRYQPVVRADASTGEYVVHMMKWGLIPRTSKAMPDYKSVLKSINARDDSLFNGPTGKPMFSHSKNHKRCIVLAQGFFEWRRRGKERVPFYTKRRDGHLLLMAGIYDVANIQGFLEPLYSYATITTNASPQLDWLHDRMPVLISNHDHEAIRAWLDPNRKWDAQLEAMLKPCAEFCEVIDDQGKSRREYILETYQVSGDVNNIRFDKKEFIEPWNTKDNMKTLARFLMPTSNVTSSNNSAKSSPHRNPVKKEEAEDEDDDINLQLLEEEENEHNPSAPSNVSEENTGNGLSDDGDDDETLVRKKQAGVDDDVFSDADVSMKREDPDVTMESITDHHDIDDDDNDPELQRILELSRQEHSSALRKAAETKQEDQRKRKLGSSGTLDQDDEEDEEFQRALEASRLQAIADGHDDESLVQSFLPSSSTSPPTVVTSSASSQSKDQKSVTNDNRNDNNLTNEELRRREEEDLERAIAASLSEATSSLSRYISTQQANPFLVSSSTSQKQEADDQNISKKKRRISSSGNGSRSVTSSPSGKGFSSMSDAPTSSGSTGPRTPKKMGGLKQPSTPGDPSISKITSFFRKAE